MLDLNKTIDQLARANGVRWNGHVLINDRKNLPRKALDSIVKGTNKIDRQRKSG